MTVRDDAWPTAEDWHRAAEAGRTEPGTTPSVTAGSVALSGSLRDAIIAWCLRGRPNEACGLVSGDGPAQSGGRALRFIGMRNAAESPYRYLLDAQEQLAVMVDLDDRDETVWAIVHSHVASPAVPSPTDVGLAFYPESLYLVCSLAGPQPELRAWTIHDGVASEVQLVAHS